VRNVEFARSAIEGFDAPDRAYDAVLGLSILHLLEDRAAAIAKINRLLKPGGVFVSSTVCIAEMAAIFRIVLPLGRVFGLVPTVGIFRAADLRADLERAGFAIEHDWQPGKGKALFIVARKAG
jgi:2-polyprenyl-3-methyl-5-hydroxy-6-metoxy-1,4-benzoquinol methylase